MIDDRTVNNLLDHIGCEVIRRMRDGKTLEEIDGKLYCLRKVDRITLFEHMAERFPNAGVERAAIVAHLRTLKRRKRPQPPRPSATVIPFRPEDRPT